MQIALLLAGLAMGVAASPHCAAMCGAPCAALTGGCRRDAAGFHLGRLVGYAAGGALAAASVSALATWSQATPALRPVWTLLHLGLLALGLWWLATGRQPAFMQRDAALPIVQVVQVVDRRARTWRAGIAGLAWVAWPCAALQAALLLSALGETPLVGALVMVAFVIGSLPGLAAAPWLFGRWKAWRGASASSASAAAIAMLGFRVAGAGLLLGSGWALTHGLWERFAAWCAS